MTQEQKAEAVLAKCEGLTKDGDFEISPRLHLKAELWGKGDTEYVFMRKNGGQSNQICSIRKSTPVDDPYWEIAYRLLSLGVQSPAPDEKTADMSDDPDYCPSCNDTRLIFKGNGFWLCTECGNLFSNGAPIAGKDTSKLIGALEQAKRYCETGNGRGGATRIDGGWLNEGSGTLYHDLLEALENWKGGKG